MRIRLSSLSNRTLGRFAIGVLVMLTAGSSAIAQSAAEQTILARIRYVFGLRAAVDTCCWKTFNAARYEVPLLYYTDTASYVANPTPRFLRIVSAVLLSVEPGLRIYRSLKRVDSQAFHMATGFETDAEDSSKIYNYNEPIMACSGFEETRRRIPDVLSVEQWATMVMHEYFHGFQYRHPALFALTHDFLYVGSDSLRRIYKRNAWFKSAIDRENGFLLAAIAAGSRDSSMIHLDSFFVARAKRRRELRRMLGVDIAAVETYYELMEGTARYAEYGLYQIFSNAPPDAGLSSIDTAFHRYEYFRNYRIGNDPWLYLTEKTAYFYATGFNMARLLDKLGIPFRETIFDRELSLEAALRQAKR